MRALGLKTILGDGLDGLAAIAGDCIFGLHENCSCNWRAIFMQFEGWMGESEVGIHPAILFLFLGFAGICFGFFFVFFVYCQKFFEF